MEKVIFESDALAGWCGGSWDPQPPESVQGINHDTRNCDEGNLYVALRGDRFDGHDFIADAEVRGACGAVVSESWRREGVTFPVLRVTETAVALRDLAAGYRRQVDPDIIGVTGSAGKTTVKELTAHMLGRAMPAARSLGNWNNDIGLPLSLLAMPSDTQAAVFEVATNQPGEIRQLCDLLNPDNGILTNVGSAHIERFGSVEAILREKSELLKSLPPHGVAVVDGESEFFESLAASVPGRVITTATASQADYTIIGRDPGTRKVRIGETESGECVSVPVDPFSEYQMSNVMMSVAMARAHHVDWEDIRAAAESYQPLPMRWQREWIREILVINDAYNANPLNMRASITAFREESVSGQKWLVLGEMRELGGRSHDEHHLLGDFLATECWAGLITVGDAAGWIAEGAETAGLDPSKSHRCTDSAEAAEVLSTSLVPGDAVLLKASRMMHLENVVSEFKKKG